MFYTLINPMDATNQVIEIKESDLLRFKNPWSNIKKFYSHYLITGMSKSRNMLTVHWEIKLLSQLFTTIHIGNSETRRKRALEMFKV